MKGFFLFIQSLSVKALSTKWNILVALLRRKTQASIKLRISEI